MKKTSFSRLLSVVLMAAFLFGCAKAPKQEIATAKASVDAAQAIKADVFASEQFTAAKGYLDAAMAEISAQNAKSPLSFARRSCPRRFPARNLLRLWRLRRTTGCHSSGNL